MCTVTAPQACLRRASAQAPGARCAQMLPPPLLICRLLAFDGLAKIGEELLNALDRALVALDFTRPTMATSVFNEFLFNATTLAQTWCILRRSHELGAGQIQLRLEEIFLNPANL